MENELGYIGKKLNNEVFSVKIWKNYLFYKEMLKIDIIPY